MTDLIKKENTALDLQEGEIYGFEEMDAADLIIPRLKVIQALSPERIDGIAQEGDILNSLTQEKLNGKRFIPIKQYYSNIYWNADRNAEQRMICFAPDGRIGEGDFGTLACKTCKRNQWDNSKSGKEAQPKCTAYINFLGFVEDDPMPVIISFARTNYNEGRKMLSIARSLRASMWNFGYTLETKKVTKDRNTWFIMVPTLAEASSEDEQTLAKVMYQSYNDSVIKASYEDMGAPKTEPVHDKDIEGEII